MHVGRKRLTAEGSKRGRERISKAKIQLSSQSHTTSQIVADAILTAASSHIRHVSAKTTVR